MGVNNNESNPGRERREKRAMLGRDKPQKNDKITMEQICNDTWEEVYCYVYFKVQNREEAEDITQEAYAKALSRWQKEDAGSDNHIGYLKTTALNVIRDRWRKTKRRGVEVDLDAINPLETAVEDPMEHSSTKIMINDALNKLGEEQRRVIELRIIRGYSVAQTAGMMDKKEATIRVIQYRALQALADILDNNELDQGGARQ
jgi:RNA polymerase sigma-70 factor (ECF subfamily)